MKKLSFVTLLGIAVLCIHGCGGPAVKPEDSMESTFKQAKKENPGAVAPAGKSGKITADGAKAPTPDTNAPQ